MLDITSNIEKIKSIKSPDEQEGIRQSYSLALESFEEFKNAIRPGRTSAEIAADIEKIARGKGAIDTLIFVEEGPYFLRKATSDKITNNSVVTAYVELIDENGYWVEKRRVIHGWGCFKRRIGTCAVLCKRYQRNPTDFETGHSD
nr:hypothetical protein [Planococcus glaciei]